MPDNLLIVWRNQQKAAETAKAEQEKDEALRDAMLKKLHEQPDTFLRIAGQRHHPWEGTFGFWFNAPSQQFLESQWERARYLDLELIPT
jgi:hypothetical protein